MCTCLFVVADDNVYMNVCVCRWQCVHDFIMFADDNVYMSVCGCRWQCVHDCLCFQTTVYTWLYNICRRQCVHVCLWLQMTMCTWLYNVCRWQCVHVCLCLQTTVCTWLTLTCCKNTCWTRRGRSTPVTTGRSHPNRGCTDRYGNVVHTIAGFSYILGIKLKERLKTPSSRFILIRAEICKCLKYLKILRIHASCYVSFKCTLKSSDFTLIILITVFHDLRNIPLICSKTICSP